MAQVYAIKGSLLVLELGMGIGQARPGFDRLEPGLRNF